MSIEHHTTRIGGGNSVDGIEQRGFPTSRWSNQGDEFSAKDTEVHVFEERNITNLSLNILDAQGQHRRRF